MKISDIEDINYILGKLKLYEELKEISCYNYCKIESLDGKHQITTSEDKIKDSLLIISNDEIKRLKTKLRDEYHLEDVYVEN